MFQVASRALSEALVDEARVARLDQDYGRAAALCREATQRAHDGSFVNPTLASLTTKPTSVLNFM